MSIVGTPTDDTSRTENPAHNLYSPSAPAAGRARGERGQTNLVVSRGNSAHETLQRQELIDGRRGRGRLVAWWHHHSRRMVPYPQTTLGVRHLADYMRSNANSLTLRRP